MTQGTYNKAKDIVDSIQERQAKIYSYGNALSKQTFTTAYSRDELSVQLYNGEGEPTTVFIPRKLVIDMLRSAMGKYRAEMDKLQAELDAL